MLDSPLVRKLVSLALEEDLSFGDITAEITVSPNHTSRARLIARQPLVFCGGEILSIVCNTGRWSFKSELKQKDGHRVESGAVLAELDGLTRELLGAERTILNFLQRMSGVATYARGFVDACSDKLLVLDTRKTMPGWRVLDKYAVRTGGAQNHRFSLGDMVLVKNNHVDAHPDRLRGVLKDVSAKKPPYMAWEVEVRDLEELRTALEFAPSIVMLDNFSDDLIQTAMEIVRSVAPRPLVEVSGGITRERARRLAEFGIDAVSSGALTTAAPNVDISMRIEAR